MKIILLVFLAFFSNDPREIAKINSLKEEAKKAFLEGNYELALAKYHLLSDSMGVSEDAIHLNLAHSYYQLNDTVNAKSIYSKLSNSSDKKLRSIAYQQLGIINKNINKLEESLQQFKSAIKADPANQEARYNYEVVKKLLEEQRKQEQQQQNQEQQDKDQENKENQGGKGEDQEKEKKEGEQENPEEQKGDRQEKGEKGEKEEGKQEEGGEEEQEPQKSQEQMTREKLKEMNISEEKARMILEAMKDNEIQYLQQQRRKAKKRPPSDKPDW